MKPELECRVMVDVPRTEGVKGLGLEVLELDLLTRSIEIRDYGTIQLELIQVYLYSTFNNRHGHKTAWGCRFRSLISKPVQVASVRDNLPKTT